MGEAGSRPPGRPGFGRAPSFARAGRLHVALLGLPGPGGGEEDRLHVRAADLRDEPDVGMQTLDTRRDRDHLLDELAADQRRDETGAGAGEKDAVAAGREAGFALHAPQELDDLLGLPGVVALVVLPADLAVLHHHRLHSGRAHVDGDQPGGERPPLLPQTPPPGSRPVRARSPWTGVARAKPAL